MHSFGVSHGFNHVISHRFGIGVGHEVCQGIGHEVWAGEANFDLGETNLRGKIL